jgi:hypothetical protein
VGVLSTYCQICGLPVQHDHYVALENEGYFRIWRGDGDDGCEPAVTFGPEHAWLRLAVGLRLDDTDPQVVIEGDQRGSATCLLSICRRGRGSLRCHAWRVPR